jgi:hypothetical protein
LKKHSQNRQNIGQIGSPVAAKRKSANITNQKFTTTTDPTPDVPVKPIWIPNPCEKIANHLNTSTPQPMVLYFPPPW